MTVISRVMEAGQDQRGATKVALVYLALLTAAELLTVLVESRIGLVLHAAVLVVLLIHAALVWEYPVHKLLLSLSFAPLIRMMSLSLPLGRFSLVYWYFITSVPLFAAVVITVRTLQIHRQDIGLRIRKLPMQVLVSASGLAFGYLEYAILRPKPLAKAFSWEDLWLPALILLVSTGFSEELIFRGLMQQAAKESLGRFGITYVSLLFAVLHVGYKSVWDVIFVFLVAMFFGYVVERTETLAGVSIAHGTTNIILFLVAPFVH